MSDLISRQAAIDAINDVIADYIPNLYGRYEALPLEMASAVNRLPSAQPTAEHVRHGRWIEHPETDLGMILKDCIECSECRVWFKSEYMFRRSFCPNCGARMDKE